MVRSQSLGLSSSVSSLGCFPSASVLTQPPSLRVRVPQPQCQCQGGGGHTLTMSRTLHDAVTSGNLAEITVRLNMGEDVNSVYPPG